METTATPDITPHPPAASQRLLTTAEAAAHIGVAPSTLAHWRSADEPHPPAIRLGRRTLRYRVAHLDAWLEAQVEQQAA